MGFSDSFCFAQSGSPRECLVSKYAAFEGEFDGLQRLLQMVGAQCTAIDPATKCRPQFQPMERREDHRFGHPPHEALSRFRRFFPDVEREENAGVGVDYHRAPSRISKTPFPFKTLSPYVSFIHLWCSAQCLRRKARRSLRVISETCFRFSNGRASSSIWRTASLAWRFPLSRPLPANETISEIIAQIADGCHLHGET